MLWMLIPIHVKNAQGLGAGVVVWGFFCLVVGFFLPRTLFWSWHFALPQLEKPILSFMFHFNLRLKIPFQWSNRVSHFVCYLYVSPLKGCTLLQDGSVYYIKKQRCEFLPHPNSTQSYSISVSYKFYNTDVGSSAKNWNLLIIGQIF